MVSIPDGAWEIIGKELKGKIGERDSRMIRRKGVEDGNKNNQD